MSCAPENAGVFDELKDMLEGRSLTSSGVLREPTPLRILNPKRVFCILIYL